MRLISVNIGTPKSQPKGQVTQITGIDKTPFLGPVQVTSLGLAGDFIGDSKNHGGPDQAVYVYGEPEYAWWSRQLGREQKPGTFGENLTIEGLESADFSVGDRLYVGAAVLEVTAPRTPCQTLARRMQDPMFVKRFRRAERPGLYCRVIREGRVGVGDEVKIDAFTGETVKVIQMFNERYAFEKHEELMRRFLRAPIAVRDRAELERRLQRLLAKS